MVELIVNGQALELPKGDTGIQYTMQIADIFNIASVASSYTNSFNIPKTPKNTQIFEQLGLVGDTSTLPYTKVPVRLNSNGFSIIAEGWLDVKGTGNEYKLNIINGMIDFFKEIENRTLGKDLDLTVFNHEKTVATVVASFSNPNYRYLIADYNGKNFGKTTADVEGINIDYLIPSFNVKKVWDLIFSTFGFTYDIADIPFINDLWITYPKPPQEDVVPELVAEFTKGAFITSQVTNNGSFVYPHAQEFWTTSAVTEGTVVNNWLYIVDETGAYQFDLETEAYFQPTFSGARPAIWIVMVNGIVIASVSTDPLAPVTLTHIESLQAGDTVQIRLISYNLQGAFLHLQTSFNISKTDLGDVSLTNAFQDFAIKDFIKEIIWRTGLTPIITDRHIDFISLDYRLDFDNAIDWSDKYIERTDETYTLSGYAQKNVFALKHNNEDDLTGNGYLDVNNRNIPDERILVNSKIYAPEPSGVPFIGFRTDKYRIWNSEAKVDADGLIQVDYKGLSNRFYFIREEVAEVETTLVSEALDTSTVVSAVPYATNEETLFDELVFKNYQSYQGVLFNFRRHLITVVLTERDILELDMTVPYFFKQEGQYYMLNKITYQEGQLSIGEFIRINKL